MSTVVAALAVALALSLLVSASSPAAFTRPFLRQITATANGAFSGVPSPDGVAVDQADDLWVGELPEPEGIDRPLDDFGSVEHTNGFIKALEIEDGDRDPEGLAIDDSTGSFYVGSFNAGGVEMFDEAGAVVKRFDQVPGETDVAVDNSTGSSAGSVYAASRGEDSVSKFNAEGEPESFAGCGRECESYVSGNRITGTPSRPFGGPSGNPVAITVDSDGDIYVVNTEGGKKERRRSTSTNPAAGLFAPSMARNLRVSVKTTVIAASADPLEASLLTR